MVEICVKREEEVLEVKSLSDLPRLNRDRTSGIYDAIFRELQHLKLSNNPYIR